MIFSVSIHQWIESTLKITETFKIIKLALKELKRTFVMLKEAEVEVINFFKPYHNI